MKTDVTQERIRNVLAGVLLPLARILLRCGVGYSEFAVLAKRAFVEAASIDYGVRNRPTNIARVAVMTGLSRKEVSRIRGRGKKAVDAEAMALTIPAAVLNEWHGNPKYVDRSGSPRLLSCTGSGLTFSALVKKVTRDIPPGAMLRELVRAGAVRIVDRGKVIPVKRHFVPDAASDRVLVGLELGLRRLAETVAFNSDPEKPGAIRFQRFVEAPLRIGAQDMNRVRAAIHERLATFSEELDDFLSGIVLRSKARLSRKATASSRAHSLGVGIYYYEDQL